MSSSSFSSSSSSSSPSYDPATSAPLLPSDVSVAFDYLIRTFPFSPPTPGYLEPRLILVNQLYALIPSDRSAVDVELAERRRAGTIRMMKVTALGVDDYAVMRVEEYREIVESMMEAKVKRMEAMKREEGVGAITSDAAPSVPAVSLLAPNTRPIKRKRINSDSGDGSKNRGEGASPPLPSSASPVQSTSSVPPSLSISASSTSSLRPPPLSPVSSPNRRLASSPQLPSSLSLSTTSSSPADDKENHSTSSQALHSHDRLADETALLRAVLSSLLPHYHDVSITRTQLISILFTPFTYLSFTADDVISSLFHHQLLVSSPTSATSSSSPPQSYLLGLPHIGEIVKEVLEARAEIERLIRGTRYREMRRSDLERRERLKGSERGVRWHMWEMIGGGRLDEVETTKGCMMRMHKEEKGRRR